MPSSSIKLFLCGDVMTGRGIDQILPNPCNPRLYEEYMASAEGYVKLAEDAHGDIPRSAPLSYIWGAALDEFERVKPDFAHRQSRDERHTKRELFPKGINYRMSPGECGLSDVCRRGLLSRSPTTMSWIGAVRVCWKRLTRSDA